ncbi:MAG: intradiol ring-cleavage dioxygenase [Burkholderiaceae bacterium]
MRNLNQDNITQAVIQSFAGTPDPRLKEIMTSLVRHLHDFARDVKLTEDEWFKGIDFLTRCGHITDERRQEFILLSDVLGLSMLTVALNNDKPPGCTEATVFGPFHVEGAPRYELGSDIANGAKGVPCLVRGAVRSLDGSPIPNARLDVWQSDEDGMYDVQHDGLDHAQARGIVHTDASGHFHFRSILAVPYAIPHDGPVGEMLEAVGRHPWRPAHLHFMIEAAGHETLITHVFRSDSEHIDSDAVFGVRQSLLSDWKEQADGSYLLEYDFVLNPNPGKGRS